MQMRLTFPREYMVVSPQESAGGIMNYQHADVIENSSPTVFKSPIPNPVPKKFRIGYPGYGQ
jgi:hypothetical protein